VRLQRITTLVILVGFAASLAGFLAHQFPWISLLMEMLATVTVAGLLDLAVGRREAALDLVRQLEVKNAQLDEALSRQAQAEQSLRQAQRMEAVGQLAGGIAHDFNNLLQAILSYSEFIADGLDAESDLQQDVAEVQKAARRAAGLTRQLLVFSRQQVTQPAVVDLNATVRSAEHLLRANVGNEVEFSFHTENDPCFIVADTSELELMLTNLAINARDAIPYSGTISITVDTIDLDSPGQSLDHEDGPFARIMVTDDGEGMTPEVAARAFEPFFTTKETGRGAGLGLAMVYGIASRSGGNASISTVSGAGTTITVLFPLATEDPAAEVPEWSELASPDRDLVSHGTARILRVAP
jgi:two-component system cell cycle sensor histidine kinase/response regulator CckA